MFEKYKDDTSENVIDKIGSEILKRIQSLSKTQQSKIATVV